MIRNNTLWVVEINFADGAGWQATVGVRFSREEGRLELKQWQDANPSDFLRLRKYTRS